MVDHIVLVEKLQLLGLPANIFNWLISILTGRIQYCKVNNVLIDSAKIWSWPHLFMLLWNVIYNLGLGRIY